MGTRGINVTVANNEVKCAQYNQWDSYPSGQGATVLNFLRNIMQPDFKEKVLACSWLTEEENKALWVSCGADPESDMVNMDVSNKFSQAYPWLHRDCGADIYEYIQKSENGLKLNNAISFAADSLFCEWGYVVDLDKGTFEVYRGFNQKALDPEERFHFLEEQSQKDHRDSQYHPIKLVRFFYLNELPTEEEFVKALEEREEDEE